MINLAILSSMSIKLTTLISNVLYIVGIVVVIIAIRNSKNKNSKKQTNLANQQGREKSKISKHKTKYIILSVLWMHWLILVACAAYTYFMLEDAMELLPEKMSVERLVFNIVFFPFVLILDLVKNAWTKVVPAYTIILAVVTLCIVISDIVRKKRDKNGMLSQESSGNKDLSNE